MAVTLNNLDVTSTAGLSLNATGANSLSLKTNSTDRIFINGSGQVAIGHTSPATSIGVHIKGIGSLLVDEVGEGGQLVLKETNSGKEATIDIVANNNEFRILNGMAGASVHVAALLGNGAWIAPVFYAPSGSGYTWSHDIDSGMFNATDGNIDFKVDGILRHLMTNNGRNAFFANLNGGWDARTVLVESSTPGGTGGEAPGIGFHAPGVSAAAVFKFYGPGNRFEFRNSNDSGWHDAYAGTFVNSSDYRLKTNIEPITSALDSIMGLQPKKYTLYENNREARGFIAHEVTPYVPEAVIGEFDAEDERGFPVHQGLDPVSILSTAVAAIQELKTIVDAQAKEIATLKGATV